MRHSNIDLKGLVNDAWANALERAASAEGSSEKSLGEIRKDRSSAWIDSLGKGFQTNYSDDDQRVFWGANKGNSRDFRLNELLFDISVCQIGYVPSLVRGKSLGYISKCFWQVESELNKKNSREITKDFSKLVLGRSENQLFISSYQGIRKEKALGMSSDIARCCNGNLYLCFIDHPETWLNHPESPSLYKWVDNNWRTL